MSSQHRLAAVPVLAASLAAALAWASAGSASAQERRSSLWDAPGSASAAAPPNDTIKKTTQLLDGMGFTIKHSSSDFIVIDSNNFNLVLESSHNGLILYGSIYYQVPKEKFALIPYEKLMEYNGRSLPHFGIDKVSDDNTELVLIDHTSVPEMTPKTLKELIDTVAGEAGRHLDLIDPSQWKSSLPEFSSK